MHLYEPVQPLYLSHIEDKLQFLRECIGQIEEQVHFREDQKQRFINELEQKTCEVHTSIYALADRSPQNQVRLSLELQIKDLEKEMRQQAVECWRDITALQREIRQLEKEYLAVRGALCTDRKR